MTDSSLEWEEGYREGILRGLKATLKIKDVKDADELFDYLARLHEESAARTESILRKSREADG